MKEILVTVYCLAYNHEKYIRDALEGFVMQKTSFPFEVIVHDDASTDNTAEIIREYAEKYPEIIKPIFQTENQYSKKLGIVKTHIFPEMRGKYVAACEGDDYWVDPYKLQTQVDILEKNPSCSICFGVVEWVNIYGRKRGTTYPETGSLAEGVIEGREFLRYVANPSLRRSLFIQISGCMWSKEIYDKRYAENPDYFGAFDVGDIPLFFYLGMHGDAYFINKTVSCYRTMNPESAVGSISRTKEKMLAHLETECNGCRAFDQYSNGIVHDAIEKGINRRKFQILRCCHDVAGMKSHEMAEFYKALPWMVKAKEHMLHYFPWMEIFYQRFIYWIVSR